MPKGIINNSPIKPLNGIATTPKTVDTKFITNEIKTDFKNVPFKKHFTKSISITNPINITYQLLIPSAIYKLGQTILIDLFKPFR